MQNVTFAQTIRTHTTTPASMPPNGQVRQAAAAWWIVFCAFCSCIGWILSAAHMLNSLGYGLALLVGLIAVLAWRARTGCPLFVWPRAARLRRRFRRPIPAAFLVLTALAFLGGALYAPNNYDALAYRVPRVLHWLAESRWHWIHTQFHRVNVRGPAFEWLMAPLILFTKSDRLFFIVNFISFSLLPGLLFTSFRRLGVNGRVAWGWMWILPVGYCYLLQAGSLGNDLFGGMFAIAAIAYGLRARQQGELSDLWVSMLAMALATGVKANNLPFMAAWGLLVAPCWKLLGKRVTATAAVLVATAVVSFFPIAVANAEYGGDWTGAIPEGLQFRAPNPLVRVAGNVGVLLVHNLMPPVAPFAKSWNTQIAPLFESEAINKAFNTGPRDPLLEAEELATDESSGLGLGCCVLLVASTLAAIRCRKSQKWPGFNSLQVSVVAGTIVGTGVVLAISGAKSGARFFDGYYPWLILPPLLLPGQAQVVRSRWWTRAVVAVALLAIAPLALNPARPLVPVRPMLDCLERLGFSGPVISRAQTVVSVYANRAESFEPALKLVPPDTRVLGYIAFDDPEAALWKPFGSRVVFHICPEDTGASLRGKGIAYILSHDSATRRFPMPFSDWLAQVNGEIVCGIPLTLRAGLGPDMWHLVRLR